MTDKIVMRDSPEAAEYRTGLCGWVSRRGLFYGDRPDSEDMARYDGCTHVACKYCSAPAQKSYTACQECRDKKDLERFEALPRADWDGKAMLYSEARDKYYAGPDDAEDELEEGETLADLRLVVCKPTYARLLDEEYFCDDLPEGEDDVPPVVEQAMEAFNAAVADVIMSWQPGKVALALEQKP